MQEHHASLSHNHALSLPVSQAQEDVRQQLREFEETKKQIEEDEDREIQDIKTKYEKKLRDEKESNLRLKGETGIMRKKVLGCSLRDLGMRKGSVTEKPGVWGNTAKGVTEPECDEEGTWGRTVPMVLECMFRV